VGLAKAEAPRGVRIGTPCSRARLLRQGGEGQGEGPQPGSGRSGAGGWEPGLAGTRGEREQKKRRNNDEKQSENYGWNGLPGSRQTLAR
jgi:hypothetical protein